MHLSLKDRELFGDYSEDLRTFWWIWTQFNGTFYDFFRVLSTLLHFLSEHLFFRIISPEISIETATKGFENESAFLSIKPLMFKDFLIQTSSFVEPSCYFPKSSNVLFCIVLHRNVA